MAGLTIDLNIFADEAALIAALLAGDKHQAPRQPDVRCGAAHHG